MPTRIDFHSHILPEMDHGCRDLRQSLAQIEMIAQSGTDFVVASSHFYPGRMNFADFVQRRARAVQLLKEHLPENAPRIAVGAEVACYPGLENLRQLSELCIAGTDCMLLEMPLGDWSDAHLETVDAISAQGFRVVMAHIDRYPAEQVEMLMQLDVQAQVNASSLCSFWRRRRVKRWFAEDRVVALGSDLHGAEVGGYSHFPKALTILGKAQTEQVMAHTRQLVSSAVCIADQ